jgi:hypothetical protein
MSFAYYGFASVTLFSLNDGVTSASTVNDDVLIKLREDESLALATVHLAGRIGAPQQTNRVIIDLPRGLRLQGALVDGFPFCDVNWFRFQIEIP